MKLFLLKRPARLVDYDEFKSFIIRAEDEKSARKIAADYLEKRGYGGKPSDWLLKGRSSCTEIGTSLDGTEGIVVDSFRNG